MNRLSKLRVNGHTEADVCSRSKFAEIRITFIEFHDNGSIFARRYCCRNFVCFPSADNGNGNLVYVSCRERYPGRQSIDKIAVIIKLQVCSFLECHSDTVCRVRLYYIISVLQRCSGNNHFRKEIAEITGFLRIRHLHRHYILVLHGDAQALLRSERCQRFQCPVITVQISGNFN